MNKQTRQNNEKKYQRNTTTAISIIGNKKLTTSFN